MNQMERSSGVLLHITSLPSKFGIGDLGPEALNFVDLLCNLNQRYWGILPLNPTNPEEGNSPYKSDSAFAGNPLLISPELLVEDELISKNEIEKWTKEPINRVNYIQASETKTAIIKKAYENFNKFHTCLKDDFESFYEDNKGWLDDYALYATLRKKIKLPWHQWPAAIRDREEIGLVQKRESLKDQVDKEKFVQFVFYKQLRNLKKCCVRKRVEIFGDLPFYVAFDSADVWANQELFKLNRQKTPSYVAGVPPDYFSKTGQLWGSPIYDWHQLKKTGYEWWLDRIRQNLMLCHKLRFDHFRGFIAYWRVPAKAQTAKSGRWIRAPTATFFRAVQENFPKMPFVAEDLGAITPPVVNAKKQLGIPGIKVLLFGFNEPSTNPNFPGNLAANSVVYTGTHDNNTVKGWFTEEATAKERKMLFQYLSREVTKEEISFELIKMAEASKSNLCIIPLQDAVGLGSEARMNNPADRNGNWEWRITSNQLKDKKLQTFGLITQEFDRA